MWHTTLFQLLYQRLFAQVLLPNGKPEILWIDFYNSQDLHVKDSPINNELPIPFPNVLIEISDIKYRNDISDALVQEASGTLRIYVGQEQYADSYQLTTDYGGSATTQPDALKRYALLQRINNALHGLIGVPLTAPLYRISEQLDIDHSNVIYDLIEYNLFVIDTSASDAAPIAYQQKQIEYLHINPDYNVTPPNTHRQTGEQDEVVNQNQTNTPPTPYIIP